MDLATTAGLGFLALASSAFFLASAAAALSASVSSPKRSSTSSAAGFLSPCLAAAGFAVLAGAAVAPPSPQEARTAGTNLVARQNQANKWG